MTTIKIVVQNLAHGGLRDGSGTPQDRWPRLLKRFAAAGDDVDAFLFCEVVDWGKYGERQLHRAMADLGVQALPLAPTSSGYGTAVLYRPDRLGQPVSWNTDFAHKVTHGFGVAAFEVGLPKPLSLVPTHLTPFGARAALMEADMIIGRAYRNGPYCVVGGDINYAPANGPEPLFEKMLPFNRSARCRLPQPGDTGPVANRDVGLTLELAKLVDVAWRLFEQTGDEALMTRTASDDRVDQVWVSSALAQAIRSYRVLDDPADASDHKGLVVELDLALAATEDVWEYR
jgi:endonuclease/exonuclease/phosphatase family metal-dependent hydrolase